MGESRRSSDLKVRMMNEEPQRVSPSDAINVMRSFVSACKEFTPS